MIDIPEKEFFGTIHHKFSHPLSRIDCGEKCGPFNDYGVPVCCDINLIVPSAYEAEWGYLKENTDLWQPWSHAQMADQDLDNELQEGQVLLKCLGHQHCKRDFRTITCRAFPFFPYLDSEGKFIGMAYFQEYRELCWVISNLSIVMAAYKTEFQRAFKLLFEKYPKSREGYFQYSSYVREGNSLSGDKIILLDFEENVFLLDPDSEIPTLVSFEDLESFGPFSITKELIFPDEIPE